MNLTWENLADCLRSELQCYGGLLQLFIDQQDNLLRRDADAVLSYANEIEAQSRVSISVRQQREAVVGELARQLDLPDDTSVRKLIPHLPEQVRPMMQALVDEINRLIHRVRRGAHHNRHLLSRTLEFHQQAINILNPGNTGKTYSPRGQVSHGAGSGSWRAAG